MNELIEKLLDEAELDIVWNQDNPDYKWVEGTEESLLKFAELIVKECIKICNHTGHDVSNGGKLIPLEFYDKAEDDLGEVAWLCADKIKEHFTIKT